MTRYVWFLAYKIYWWTLVVCFGPKLLVTMIMNEREWFFFSSWRIEFSFLEMLSNVKILKKKFSFSSRNSRFWKKFSFTSRKNEILQTDSLSLLDSSLNVFSNSREKSYFALWVDFDHQCFAERESILKRQFCVVEQYSDFSLQKHFMETTTAKSHLWEYFEWLPSGKGICKTCKNEIVDWLGWRVRTRGGGEEIDFLLYLILATIKWIIIALPD